MAKAIELTDFSVSPPIENSKLYKKLQDISLITLDTSVCDVVSKQKDIEPILEIHKGVKENEVIITTFGYVGKFSAFGVEFNIGYRFGNILLDRMVAKVNDFEMKSLELESIATKNKSQNDNLVMRMLYMHFILKLEKLSILGLPKSYVRVEHHQKFKGQIDINRYIKKDVPFQGKISSKSYEQEYVQEIVDVLYTALNEVEKSFKESVTKRVFQTRNLLMHYANRQFVNEEIITKALNHKVLQNSLYSEFKVTLEIASFIIHHTFNIKYKNNKLLTGLVFDVSLLWENYLYKLLKENFENDGWNVIHEDELNVYKNNFYARRMLPDIVMKKDNKVIVFDAKSKSMTFEKGLGNGERGDLDRNDFFQVNTYMTYYNKQKNLEVIAGGLLYPIGREFNCRFNNEICKENYEKWKAHSDNWFGDETTKFIVDGIDLSFMTDKNDSKKKKDDILKSEKAFIIRIKRLAK